MEVMMTNGKMMTLWIWAAEQTYMQSPPIDSTNIQSVPRTGNQDQDEPTELKER